LFRDERVYISVSGGVTKLNKDDTAALAVPFKMHLKLIVKHLEK
jgi:hypothetical protein